MMDRFREALKSYYKGLGRFHLVPSLPESQVLINDVWVNLLVGNVQYSGASTVDYYGGCLSLARPSNIPVIVQGSPGAGKSMLVKKICCDWATGSLPYYDLLLFAKLRDLRNISPVTSLTKLCLSWLLCNCKGLDLDEPSLAALKENIDQLDPSRVLLLLDGLDEAVPRCGELVDLMETGSAHVRFPTIITTRPYKVLEIKSAHHSCEIKGLSLSQQTDFVQKHFTSLAFTRDAQRISTLRDALIVQLERSTQLQQVLSVPLLLYLTCLSEYVPQTETFRQTDLYTVLSSKVLQADDARMELEDSISWMECDVTKTLGQLAFHMLLQDEDGILSFSANDLKQFNVDIRKCMNMGFLSRETASEIIDGVVFMKEYYSFIHKSLQEFFAAITFSRLVQDGHPEFENFAEKLLKLNADSGNQILMFFFGLTAEVETETIDKLLRSVLTKELNLKPSFGIWGYLSCNYQFFLRIIQECTGPRKDLVRQIIATAIFSSLLFENSPPMELLLQIYDPEKLEWLSDRFFLYNNSTCLYDGLCGRPFPDLKASPMWKLTDQEIGSFHFGGTIEQIPQLASYFHSKVLKVTFELHGDWTHDGATISNVKWPFMKNLHALQFSIAELNEKQFELGCFASLFSKAPHLEHFSIFGAGHLVNLASMDQICDLDRIIMYNLTLDRNAVDCLCREISTRKRLCRLSLVNCKLREGLLSIVAAMESHSSAIWYVDFSSNHSIGKDVDLFAKFCDQICSNSSLLCLCMNDCALSDVSGEILLKFKIRKPENLKDLFMKGNRFSDEMKQRLKTMNFVRL